MDSENSYRINSIQGFFLISAAIAIDAIQALLDIFIIGGILNRIISPFVWLFFWTWFHFLGIKFMKSPKNQATAIIGFLIEMIPYVDILPGWTVSTLILISVSRREDAGKVQPTKKTVKENSVKKTGEAGDAKKKERLAEQKPGVDSGVKPAVESPKQQLAGKELIEAQTGGTKTSEAKPEKEQDWKNPDKKTVDDGEGSKKRKEKGKDKEQEKKPEPGEVNKRNGAEETGDTRTDWYKRKQSEQGLDQKQADYEDIVMDDDKVLNIMDPYREPIEINKKNSRYKDKTNTDNDESLAEAA